MSAADETFAAAQHVRDPWLRMAMMEIARAEHEERLARVQRGLGNEGKAADHLRRAGQARLEADRMARRSGGAPASDSCSRR